TGQGAFAVDGGTSISMTGNDERSENGGREDGLFVGREAETALLMEQLRGALAGRPQAAFIVGEAGAGKTSLMQAFARQAQREVAGLLVVGGEGNAFSGSGDPYLPFREILEMLTGE